MRRRQERALSAAVKALADEGYAVSGLRVGVADLGQIRRAMAEMRAQSITVDLLVNNAGIVVGKAFGDHSHEKIDRRSPRARRS